MPGSHANEPSAVVLYGTPLSIYSRDSVHVVAPTHLPSLPFKTVRYEPEVAKFVKEHGSSLGLPRQPCTPEQAEWEDIAAKKRKQ